VSCIRGATNKTSLRKRATNNNGRGQKQGEVLRSLAKTGDQSTKVDWISGAVEVGGLCEFKWKIERGRPVI
jgi:hypothetical protein